MASYGGGTLSAITVQSLADLGYGVDVTQADAIYLARCRRQGKCEDHRSYARHSRRDMLRRPMPMPCLVTIHTGKGGSRGGCPCFPETTA